MADVLAGLLGGMQAGKAANAARAAAEEKRKQDAAEWELKLAGESRLLTGAAEDEWNKMEESTNADDWDTAKVPSLLDRAVRFDQTLRQGVARQVGVQILQRGAARQFGGGRRRSRQGRFWAAA
jgi:hypothetical protein